MNPSRTLAALQQAVYDLATVHPHVPPGLRLTRVQFCAYWQGYYHAVQTVLRVMETTIARENLRRRERRRNREGSGAA